MVREDANNGEIHIDHSNAPQSRLNTTSNNGNFSNPNNLPTVSIPSQGSSQQIASRTQQSHDQSQGGQTSSSETQQQNTQSSRSNGSSGNSNSISYAAERVVGNGSFGVVYQALVQETNETVAIKKVLQDKRFKNRELQIMHTLKHPCVVQLKHCFYSRGGPNGSEVYLNLVMEYIPDTIHRAIRSHMKAKRPIPEVMVCAYTYQICRSLAYIHSLGVCHRDIKPQNLLLNADTHEVRLCDFGSAKVLVPGEPNVAYICSRYYRAPELVLEASEYTVAIDVWSVGCVLAEMLTGTPIFPGENGSKQLDEIASILGVPSKEDFNAMNKNYNKPFPQHSRKEWSTVLGCPPESAVVDLVRRMLQYHPLRRITAIECLAHPFFDIIRDPKTAMPYNNNIHTYTTDELHQIYNYGLLDDVVPERTYPLLSPKVLDYVLYLKTNRPNPTSTAPATSAPTEGAKQ